MSLLIGLVISGSLRTFRQLQNHPFCYSESRAVNQVPALVLVNLDEDHEESETYPCFDSISSLWNHCSTSYPCDNTSNIPFMLRSDSPISVICPSSHCSDLHTILSVPTSQMGIPNGIEFCTNGPRPESLRLLLASCIWLILRTYALVAIMGPVLMLCKPRKRILESELPINDASTKHKLGKLVYVSGAPLPTPDEITERTLKQYGHICKTLSRIKCSYRC
jgi:hypothetical protein